MQWDSSKLNEIPNVFGVMTYLESDKVKNFGMRYQNIEEVILSAYLANLEKGSRI